LSLNFQEPPPLKGKWHQIIRFMEPKTDHLIPCGDTAQFSGKSNDIINLLNTESILMTTLPQGGTEVMDRGNGLKL
jgi:hypothetical protein